MHSPPKVRALMMLNELHRLGFERLRFANFEGDRLHIYAAGDESDPEELNADRIPALRSFSLPLTRGEAVNGTHLGEKWKRLILSEMKPNHLAGLFVLDYPDIARHGFGPDLGYREWFRKIAAQLDFLLVPVTHPDLCFGMPHDPLEWETEAATMHPKSVPAPPQYEPEETAPRQSQAEAERQFHFAIRALMLLNELHRFGFEQLRCESYGGHGFVHIFAARDEVPVSCQVTRFAPAVRRFSTIPDEEEYLLGDPELAAAWRNLLHGPLKPNHLAGLFLLDYADVARHGFGPDQEYRHWFRGLQPFLQSGLLPITHAQCSHQHPLRPLNWGNPYGFANPVSYPGPPMNPYMAQNEPLI